MVELSPSRSDYVGFHSMRILTSRAKASVALIAFICMVLAGVALTRDDESVPVAAHASTITARISPLPDDVSNGTWQILDASGSTTTSGLIRNYTWEISHNGTSVLQYSKMVTYKFEDLGLYKITLTVSDSIVSRQGNYSVNFTAVFAIMDSDLDSLPDWWEIHYFSDLSQDGGGDYDHDGYTNLEEFSRGTDPTVKNAQPGLADMLVKNWMYLVAIVAVIAVAFIILFPRYKKKQKADVKKKIEAAIEIEKALDFEK